MNLMQASNEWANRPADERFETLKDLYLATYFSYQNAQQQDIPLNETHVTTVGSNLLLVARENTYRFNHWSFGQLATKVGAPASYLRSLPAELAAQNLNHGLDRSADEAQIYFDKGSFTARAITSTKYGRLPNHEIAAKILALPGNWRTPPARPAMPGQPGTRKATAEDVQVATNIQIGDDIAPAGLYASDRNMFIFMVNPDQRIEDGSDGGLSRGFFIRNSEVGDANWELFMFLYRYTCGNHIIWGAEQVKRFKRKHLGRGVRVRALENIQGDLKTYTDSSMEDDRQRMVQAKNLVLGANLDEITELVFEKKQLLTKKNVEGAYEAAEQHSDVDGDPRTAWGFAQGITRISQVLPYADERNALDQAASKILALAA